MRGMQRALVFLVLYLAIFFNIERFDFGAENVIDIQTFVYPLVTLAITSILILPALRRWSAATAAQIWLVVYVICRLSLANQRPLLGGIYTYLTITEMVFLVLAIYLTHRLVHHWSDFEEAVANITLAGAEDKVRELGQAVDVIEAEMIRSRRYRRPLSVVVLEPDPVSIQATLHRTVQEVQQAMMLRYVLTGLARLIRENIRRTDLLFAQRDQNRFVILAPETLTQEAGSMVDRLQSVAHERMGVSLVCGTASFPDEALTFETLVNHAEWQSRQRIASTPPQAVLADEVIAQLDNFEAASTKEGS